METEEIAPSGQRTSSRINLLPAGNPKWKWLFVTDIKRVDGCPAASLETTGQHTKEKNPCPYWNSALTNGLFGVEQEINHFSSRITITYRIIHHCEAESR